MLTVGSRERGWLHERFSKIVDDFKKSRGKNLPCSRGLKRTNEKKQRHSDKSKKQHNVSKTTEGPVAIMDDSMLKMLSPSKLRRSIGKKITVQTFPGATASDMKHYIQPSLKKNPQLAVLRMETNDIQHKEPDEIAKEVPKK